MADDKKSTVVDNEFAEGSIMFPKEMIIFGETSLSIGLFGLEFSKKGYNISIVDNKPGTHKGLEYTVNVGSEINVINMGRISLKDEDKLAQKTQTSGLIVVCAPLKEYDKIGKALGNALANGYCQIDKHERHFLNVLACSESPRPASTLRDRVHETWNRIPRGHYLSRLGVMKFRITNAIASRGCEVYSASGINTSFDWEILIERDVHTKAMKKFGEYRILSTEKEVKKAEKNGNLSTHEQFLGQIENTPQIKYINNIQYDSHFKK